MCGISGYVGTAAEVATLERMSATLAHRGPDESGLFVGEGFALAHRRLSVIDLAGGHQPMHSSTVGCRLSATVAWDVRLRPLGWFTP